MNCKNCTQSLDTDMVFCGNCGSKIVKESPPIVKSEKTKKFWKYIFYLALIIGGIALVVALGPLWIIAIALVCMIPLRNR